MDVEKLLEELMTPNTRAISQAAKVLGNLFKSGQGVPVLVQYLLNSQNSEKRQHAAILLSQHLRKEKNWNRLAADVKTGIKSSLLLVFTNEQDKAVVKRTITLVGAIAGHELKNNLWPELVDTLRNLISSENQGVVELGMYAMSILTDVAFDVFAANPAQFIGLFETTFRYLDDLNTPLGHYTVVTMTRVVSLTASQPQLEMLYVKAVEKILAGLAVVCVNNEETAMDIIEFFEDILNDWSHLLTPHMMPFLQMFLTITSNKALDDELRERAMTTLLRAVRVKKKLVRKLGMMGPLLDVVFAVMCEPPNDEEDPNEDDWFKEDYTTPFQNATEVLSVLAVHIPPKLLMENIMRIVDEKCKSPVLSVKKACYLALGAISEGAGEYIRHHNLEALLKFVLTGTTDNMPIVRNAALYALGEFSEHLQPEISTHHKDIMPILIAFLNNLRQRTQRGSVEPRGIYSLFFAIETVCQNLEALLVPYLPGLMECMLVLLDRSNSVRIQEYAISAVGSIATATEQDFLPYFPATIEKIRTYLLDTPTNETECLQSQALQTLGEMIRTMGPEHFAPMAEETVRLGLNLLQSTEDPEHKGALFFLFGALSSVLKEDSAVFLAPVVTAAIASLKSTEGISKPGGPTDNLCDSDTDGEVDIDNDSVVSSDSDIAVENPYMEEKERACCVLNEFAEHTGSAFQPFVESCFEEVYEMTSYLGEDVRVAAMAALAQFCISFSKIGTPQGVSALQKSLELLVNRSVELAAKDEDPDVVNASLDSISCILKEVGAPVLQVNGAKDAIIKIAGDVLMSKVKCQDQDEDDDEDEVIDDEGESSVDETLLESAAGIIPALGNALSPQEYYQYFLAFLPYILPKMTKMSSIAQKSMFVGTLAECMVFAGPGLQQNEEMSLQLLDNFSSLSRDPNEEVRNNAIFAIGELVLHCKILNSKYPQILQNLSNSLAKETYQIAIDNICAAVAKMIVANADLVPVDEVFPAILEKLPFKEDHTEHKAVLLCVRHLYERGHPALHANITKVFRILASIIIDKLGDKSVLGMSLELLHLCQGHFAPQLAEFLQSLPPEASQHLQGLLKMQA